MSVDIETKKQRSREVSRRYRAAHPEKAKAVVQQNYQRLRTAVFNHYGWACACCSAEGSPTIDHVAGDGSEHRAELTGRDAGGASVVMYKWLVDNDFPEGFQTLCRRCNASKLRGTACRINHTGIPITRVMRPRVCQPRGPQRYNEGREHVTMPDAPTPNQIVAHNMACRRIEVGMTQDQLAAELTVRTGRAWSKTTVSVLERSRDGKKLRRFDADDLVAIADVLRVPIQYLFTGPGASNVVGATNC